MASQATSQWSGPPHTPEVFEVLKQCAADGDTIGYGRLATRVAGSGADPRSVLPALDYIRDHLCLPCDLPWLWVLAVSQATDRPGKGAWKDTGVNLGNAINPRNAQLWSDILQRIYAYDWSDIKIEKGCPDRRSNVPRRPA